MIMPNDGWMGLKIARYRAKEKEGGGKLKEKDGTDFGANQKMQHRALCSIQVVVRMS
jgi:hypothetical protein